MTVEVKYGGRVCDIGPDQVSELELTRIDPIRISKAYPGRETAEVALYDAIAQNDAALEMGDDTLKKIAVDLVWAVRSSVVIDWDQKESVRAPMRSKVRRLLARYDYPPDAEAKAVELVLEQAELFAHGEVSTA
ncbi:DUF3387 domain-containing protein [Sphingomonas sp. BLCC-B65]|nr:DUF3387 domain-containing protein [Sphingomonas sp. BLCC-B65]